MEEIATTASTSPPEANKNNSKTPPTAWRGQQRGQEHGSLVAKDGRGMKRQRYSGQDRGQPLVVKLWPSGGDWTMTTHNQLYQGCREEHGGWAQLATPSVSAAEVSMVRPLPREVAIRCGGARWPRRAAGRPRTGPILRVGLTGTPRLFKDLQSQAWGPELDRASVAQLWAQETTHSTGISTWITKSLASGEFCLFF